MIVRDLLRCITDTLAIPFLVMGAHEYKSASVPRADIQQQLSEVREGPTSDSGFDEQGSDANANSRAG